MTDLHAFDPVTLLGVAVALVLVQTGLVVGFLVPAGKAAVLAGVLAGVGELHPVPTYLGLAGAAILGATGNYLLGRRYGDALFDNRVLARHADRLDRARALAHRRAGFSLLAGRSLAVLRATTPALAGAVGVPLRRFAFYNVLGGLVWSLVFVGSGFLGGRLLPRIELSPVIVAVAFAVVFGLAATAILVRRRLVVADPA